MESDRKTSVFIIGVYPQMLKLIWNQLTSYFYYVTNKQKGTKNTMYIFENKQVFIFQTSKVSVKLLYTYIDEEIKSRRMSFRIYT